MLLFLFTNHYELIQNIGFSLSKENTFYFIGGYLLFAFGLFAFIEIALENSDKDAEKLILISSLVTTTT